MNADDIIGAFLSLENPAIYAILFTVIIVIVILRLKQEYIKPLTKKKIKLELENAKLAAMYSEVDPDPVIRLDSDWNILDMNNSAKYIFRSEGDLEKIITKIRNINKKNGNSEEIEIAGKYFSVDLKEIKDLNYWHIYLHDITNRVEYEKRIKNYQNSLKELRIKIDNVNEEEKQRVGKELHDSVGHNLSLLKIEIQNLLENSSRSIKTDEAANVLRSIDELSEGVRDLSHQLRPRILAEFGLLRALKSLVDKVNQTNKLKGYVIENRDFDLLDERLEQNIYRICQEAVNNIVKHSDSTEFFVHINIDDEILDVSISDDGIGFDLEEQFSNERTSLGLLNMKERAESVGGSFSIDSMINMGTTIYMKFKAKEKLDD